MTTTTLEGVLFSGILVLIAIGVSWWWKIPVQKDMAIGSLRAFLQLIAVGFLLRYIFGFVSPLLVLLTVFVMLLVGAWVASRSVGSMRGSFVLCFVAMTTGSLVTLGVMLLFGIISLEARYVIPLAGMIVSNSMNAATLTVHRLHSEIRAHRLAIETALSLGKTWREASRPFQRQSAIAGMVSVLNFLKTVGIVALPGAMTGMILAGADPLDAVLVQIVVAYMLLSAVTLTTLVALELAVRCFFTPFHQLIPADD